VQDYLKKEYQYEFIIAKSLPYAPKILGKFNSKWKTYIEYTNKRIISIKGYKTIIYTFIAVPSSNFWINYCLLPINYFWFHLKVKKSMIKEIENIDLVVSQNIFPDAVFAYWLSLKLKVPYIINLRGSKKQIIHLYPLF
jgi:hypothetical protein